MDERFLGIEKRMEQGLAHAEMAREQDFVHINPRLDDMNKRFDDLRNTMLMLYIPVALAILGAVVTYLFFRWTYKPLPHQSSVQRK